MGMAVKRRTMNMNKMDVKKKIARSISKDIYNYMGNCMFNLSADIVNDLMGEERNLYGRKGKK